MSATHLSLLMAAPGDIKDSMRPVSRAVSLLRSELPARITNARRVLAPIQAQVNPALDRYENAIGRMLDNLSERYSADDRMSLLTRVARLELDKILEAQAEAVKKLTDRTIRLVANQIHVQGYPVFGLKPKPKPKKKQKRAAAGEGEYIDKVAPRKRGQSRAETWSLDDLRDVVSQVIERDPGAYYSAWSFMEVKVSKWWGNLLTVCASHVEGFRSSLFTAPVVLSAEVISQKELLSLAERIDRPIKSGDDTIVSFVVPPSALPVLNVDSTVQEVLTAIEGMGTPKVKSLRKALSSIHRGSALRLSEVKLYDAFLEGFGRWAFALRQGQFSRTITGTVPLVSRAQGELPDVQRVWEKRTASVRTKHTFRSVPVSEKGRLTALDLEFTLSRKAVRRALQALLADVHSDVANNPKMVMDGTLRQISGHVTASSAFDVELDAEIRDGTPTVFLKVSTEMPVKRVGTPPSSALVAKTRASLQAILGSPTDAMFNAKEVESFLVEAVDSYPQFEDTPDGVRYSITTVFQASFEALESLEFTDELRRILTHTATMTGTEAGPGISIPSQQRMVVDFLEVHGAAKARHASGSRALKRRVTVFNSAVPGRTFDSRLMRTHGKVTKYKIRISDDWQIVSSVDGWEEVVDGSSP